MSKKVARRKKIKLKAVAYFAIFSLLIIAIAISLVVRLQFDIKKSIIKHYTVDLGEVKKSITKDMVVIRDNVSVKSEKAGILTKFYSQGQRVPKGAVICKIQDSQNSENEIAEQNKLNMQIDTLQNGAINYSPEIQSKQLQDKIAALYEDLQDRIKTKDFKYVSNIKSELSLLIAQANAVSGNTQSPVANLASLISQRDSLRKKLDYGKSYVKSEMPGALSYFNDGYETLFSMSNMKNITVKDLKNANPRLVKIDQTKVNQGDLIAYIVGNHYYYMATDIGPEDIEAIKRDTKLDIIVQDMVINAYFYDFYKDKNGEFIGFFKVESDDYDYLKNRKDKAKIIYSTAKGLLIPNDAIVDDNGEKGVYKVDKTGTANFVKLDNILLSDEQNTVISYSFDAANSPTNLSLYDDIILTPKNVKDGQKVK